jgi:hypothetical protein
MGQLSGRRTGACITRWYQRDRALPHELPVGQVRSVAVQSGTTVEVPLTMVRPYMRNGSRRPIAVLQAPRNPCPTAVCERAGVARANETQAAVCAGVVAGGCLMRPMPRGIGEITYTIAPRMMIESTLITQSRMVIAVASGSGTL